jgi:hypothetical protein
MQMVFSDYLNTKLGRRGWSGPEMARQMKRVDPRNAVSGSAVNAWRRGEYLPKREHIPAIARVLEASEQEIWRLVQPDVAGNPEVAEMLAREIPKSMTPREVRLLAYLMRANVQALQAWGRGEDAQDAARDAQDMPGSTGEEDRPGARVRSG